MATCVGIGVTPRGVKPNRFVTPLLAHFCKSSTLEVLVVAVVVVVVDVVVPRGGEGEEGMET